LTIRTTSKTVTFIAPFFLSGLDEVVPAGRYTVETDEELLEGVSFPAYRRISTLIHLHVDGGVVETVVIDPKELDAALARDVEMAETKRRPNRHSI
jgi:hypothetical protein